MARKRKKKKTSIRPTPVSPTNYVRTRAKSLPIHKCFINPNWQIAREASVVVTRRHVTAGIYLVDLLAYGVKDTFFVFNQPEKEFFSYLQDLQPEGLMEEIPYALAHNIVYGALAFAEDYDLKPHKDFSITEHILDEDTDDIKLIDIEFGVEGKPVFMENLYDEEERLSDEIDYCNRTDEEWRDFFASTEDISPQDLADMTDILFEKWLKEKYPPESLEKTVELEAYTITHDALDMPYYKDHGEKKKAQDIYLRLVNAKPSEVEGLEKRLHKMIAANPENPIYYNYLAVAAQIQNNDHKYKNILKTTIKLFSSYLFGKVAMANLLLDDGKPKKVEELFNHSFHLKELYPERDIFHITEVIAFHGTLIRYFIQMDDLKMANFHVELLYGLGVDHEMDQSNIFKKAEEEFSLRKIVIVSCYVEEMSFEASLS